MFWCEGDECDSEQGVRAGRENANGFFAPFNTEFDFCSFGPTQPVFLHQSNTFWKFDGIEAIEQLLSILGDVNEPLTHVLLSYRTIASPTSTCLDLFVGKDRGTGFTPIDRSKLTIGESGFEKSREEQLVPLVVIRIVTLDQSAPIVRESHALDLFCNGCHVLLGNVVRMATFSNGRIFGWHSKRIKSHGIEDVEAFHSLVSGNSITNRIVSNVTHVHFSGWIGVHLQTVEFRLGCIIARSKDVRIVPCLLPCNFIRRLHLIRHVDTSYAKHASMLSFFNPPQRIEFRGSSRSVGTLRWSQEGTSLPW